MAWLYVLVLGHLGNHLEAFAEVRRLGADGVELDVRRGLGGELLVHHDPVGDATGLPTLEQVLDACQGLVVNIELKNLRVDPDFDPAEGLSRDVVALLHQRERRDRVVLSSFSLPALDAVRAADDTIPTTFLTLPDWDQRRALDGARKRGHTGIHPHEQGLTAELVEEAHAHGLTVTPWAVDDPETVRRVAAHGVDGVISDTPEAIRAARFGP